VSNQVGMNRRRFQSAPGDEAGRNSVLFFAASRPCRFQSAPGDEAGRNEFYYSVPGDAPSFNPLPAMKPGGTRRISPRDCWPGVSIRSRR